MKITSIIVAAWLITSNSVSVEGRLLRRPTNNNWKKKGRGKTIGNGKKNFPWIKQSSSEDITTTTTTTTTAATTTTNNDMDISSILNSVEGSDISSNQLGNFLKPEALEGMAPEMGSNPFEDGSDLINLLDSSNLIKLLNITLLPDTCPQGQETLIDDGIKVEGSTSTITIDGVFKTSFYCIKKEGKVIELTVLLFIPVWVL